MRLKYKGYMLVADRSFEREGEVIACIFSLPSYATVHEEWTDCSPSAAIKQLKQKVNQLLKT